MFTNCCLFESPLSSKKWSVDQAINLDHPGCTVLALTSMYISLPFACIEIKHRERVAVRGSPHKGLCCTRNMWTQLYKEFRGLLMYWLYKKHEDCCARNFRAAVLAKPRITSIADLGIQVLYLTVFGISRTAAFSVVSCMYQEFKGLLMYCCTRYHEDFAVLGFSSTVVLAELS